jgi:hypothetical protein
MRRLIPPLKSLSQNSNSVGTGPGFSRACIFESNPGLCGIVGWFLVDENVSGFTAAKPGGPGERSSDGHG